MVLTWAWIVFPYIVTLLIKIQDSDYSTSYVLTNLGLQTDVSRWEAELELMGEFEPREYKISLSSGDSN